MSAVLPGVHSSLATSSHQDPRFISSSPDLQGLHVSNAEWEAQEIAIVLTQSDAEILKGKGPEMPYRTMLNHANIR